MSGHAVRSGLNTTLQGMCCWVARALGSTLARPQPSLLLRDGLVTQRERVRRIELPYSAWEADVLPLNYTRRCRSYDSGLGAIAVGLDMGPQSVQPMSEVFVASVDHIDRSQHRGPLRGQHGQQDHHRGA